MKKKPIYVTQPSLPPLDDFIPYLREIWESQILTNNGPMHQSLEKALCEYLNVEHISLFNNGTSALITAVQALGITGEVITTPYSFVATAHSLVWNRVQPVFVDIEDTSFNLDPQKIERAISPSTRAIMPVHCYGNPCNVDAIQRIAEQYGLKVIYDAAHAFGVKDSGGSILRHGDLSVLSFHATKVFNTFEGGAIISANAEMKNRIDQLKNFGITDELTVSDLGLNGKMSEINAAFGILQLKHIDTTITNREKIDQYYRAQLSHIPGIDIPIKPPGIISNHAYFPILINDNYPLSRDQLYQKLKDNNILSRRYFFPLISEFSPYAQAQGNFPVAKKISSQVICLPMHANLELEDVNHVVKLIRDL